MLDASQAQSTNTSSRLHTNTTPLQWSNATTTFSNLTGPNAACQTSWNTYWSLLAMWQMGYKTYTASTLTTAGTTFSMVSMPASTVVLTPYTTTGTETLSRCSSSTYDIFCLSPYETVTTWTESGADDTVTYPDGSGATAVFETLLIASTDYNTMSWPSPTAPPCSPPTDAAACSSSWNSWSSREYYSGEYPLYWPIILLPSITVSSVPTPSCYHPPLNSHECQQAQSLLSGYLSFAGGSPGGSTWNRYMELAPGCSLGCSSCGFSASTVQILYWPTTSGNGNKTIMPHSSSTPQSVYAVVGDSTTLTSPTVYLSFADLSAQDSCSPIGSTYASGIIPIDENNLVWLTDADLPPGDDEIVTHDLGSLKLPFSEFLYFQAQNFTHFWLSLPGTLTSVDPAWQSCTGNLLGA